MTLKCRKCGKRFQLTSSRRGWRRTCERIPRWRWISTHILTKRMTLPIFLSTIFRGHLLREDVSWNAFPAEYTAVTTPSSSSWGCELKCSCLKRDRWIRGHPLREDVSWNTSPTAEPAVAKSSSSSWGCELKWRRECKRWGIHQSSSSWGCELKYKSLGRRKNVW